MVERNILEYEAREECHEVPFYFCFEEERCYEPEPACDVLCVDYYYDITIFKNTLKKRSGVSTALHAAWIGHIHSDW